MNHTTATTGDQLTNALYALGVRFIMGGQHVGLDTKNSLVYLNQDRRLIGRAERNFADLPIYDRHRHNADRRLIHLARYFLGATCAFSFVMVSCASAASL